MNDIPTEAHTPTPSPASVSLATTLIKEYPTITHGISIPSSVAERAQAENDYCASIVARFLQATFAISTVDALKIQADQLKEVVLDAQEIESDRNNLRIQLSTALNQLRQAREIIRLAHETLGDAPEINIQNYTEDQVSMLNDFVIAVHKILSAALTTSAPKGEQR